MKRSLIIVLALSMFFAGSTVVRAEEEGSGIEVGLKVWQNALKEEAGGHSETSNTIMLAGPTIEVKASSGLFMEASYMTSLADYKIDVPAAELSRKDIDLAIGVMFSHNFGILAGYRNSVVEEKSGAMKTTVSGPLAGVRAGIPLGDVVSIYGKLVYLLNKSKMEMSGGSYTEDAPGYVAEAGVAIEVAKHIGLNVGYQVETTEGKDSKIKDTFSGLTAGARIAF